MALARIKIWNAGDVLKAADLNSEFNNYITNPIALISPTTGAINFNLTAHTNLIIGALSASSGSTGQSLIISSGGVPIWSSTGTLGGFTNFTTFSSGQIPVGTTSGALTPIAIGTTGQVLAVTSSNSTPAWQVLPPSGGLTTGTIAGGNIFYISTGGATLIPLAIGTSGQTLQVSTSGVPIWAAAAAGGTGLTVLDKTGVTTTFTTTGTLYTFAASGGGLGSSGQYRVTLVGQAVFSDSGNARFQLSYGGNIFTSGTNDLQLVNTSGSVTPVNFTLEGLVSANAATNAQTGSLRGTLASVGGGAAAVLHSWAQSPVNPTANLSNPVGIVFSATSTKDSTVAQTLAILLSSVSNLTRLTVYHADTLLV